MTQLMFVITNEPVTVLGPRNSLSLTSTMNFVLMSLSLPLMRRVDDVEPILLEQAIGNSTT